MNEIKTGHEQPFDELISEVASLRQKNSDLEREKHDLKVLLEKANNHSDTLAEAAVRESEQRLKMIIEATPVAVVVTDISTKIIVFTNAIAGVLSGFSPEEIIGYKMPNLYVNPLERDLLIEELNKEGEVNHREIEFVRKDKSKIWVDISLRYIEFNKKPCILGAWTDISHLKNLNLAASRFVPQEYLSFLNKDSLVDIQLGDHVSGEMTVMFSDLRSFTAISESMTPQQNFDFINAYLRRVSPMVRKNGGFIVKYLGDGIMAIFPGTADSGVQASIDKIKQVNNYNVQRLKHNRLPIGIGIGINTGHMMVGMVGETSRMQGDAFSDDVNLTSRVEGLTKFYSVPLIITASTKNALVDGSKYKIRFLDKVQVKGKKSTLVLYEVYDTDSPNFLALKQESHQRYEEAMQYYYEQDFIEAQSLLFDVLKENPKDKVAWRHLMAVTECIENGVRDNWTGVTVMKSK